MASETPREQPNFPVMEHGIVVNPADPDVVMTLRHDYIHGNITLEEFEAGLDEQSWI